MPDEIQSIMVLLRVLDQNIDDEVVLAMLLREIRCLVVIATLPAHGDRRVQVKLQVSGRLDKLLKLVDVLEFGITVQQQGRVVCRCSVVLVKLFQILNQVVDSLGVQELRKVRQHSLTPQWVSEPS